MSTLTSYLSKRLEAWVPVDGLDGFEVKLGYLSREEINKIRKASTNVSFNRQRNLKTEELDQDLFVKEFIKSTVLSWRGFTIKVAAQLLPITPPEGIDENTEIDFTIEEAITLAKESTFFDNWLNEVVFDLQTFRTRGDRV